MHYIVMLVRVASIKVVILARDTNVRGAIFIFLSFFLFHLLVSGCRVLADQRMK